MYEIKIEEKGKINMATNKYYSDILGITQEYVGKILNGKLPAKGTIAKGIISIAYNIPIDDYNMETLLNKHFTKIN